MDCQYCEHHANSKWRINPGEEEEPNPTKRRTKGKLRHCKTIGKYIHASQEACKDFVPNAIFWCNNNNHWQHVDACINRNKKKLDDACLECRQFNIIKDLSRAMSFHKRKIAEIEKALEGKPVLKRRTSNEEK